MFHVQAPDLNYAFRFYFRGDTPDIIAESATLKSFMLSDKYKPFINNIADASHLLDSPCNPQDLVDELYFNSYTPPEIEDLKDVKSGKALLRVNVSARVVYTVHKFRDWFIFKVFWASDSPIEVAKWCVKKLPNLSGFKDIKPGVTTFNEVVKMDASCRFVEEGDTLRSKHVFADEHGSIAHIEYKKNDAGKFLVDKVYWESNGRNLLPYLLPIDRQLIDPSYVPPEDPGCTIM